MSSQLLLHDAAGWHWWFAPFWFFLWIVLIVAIVRFWPWWRRYDRRADARAILSERYARGEIDAEEYATRRDVLSQ